MAAFEGRQHNSTTASQLLHPSAMWDASTPLEPGILADMASGLAASVDPDAPPADGTVLLAGAGYVIQVECIDPDSVLIAGGTYGRAAAFAVVRGELLVWTRDHGPHALGPEATCAMAADERLQVVNFGPEPVVVVTVRALSSASGGTVARVLRPFRSLVN